MLPRVHCNSKYRSMWCESAHIYCWHQVFM